MIQINKLNVLKTSHLGVSRIISSRRCWPNCSPTKVVIRLLIILCSLLVYTLCVFPVGILPLDARAALLLSSSTYHPLVANSGKIAAKMLSHRTSRPGATIQRCSFVPGLLTHVLLVVLRYIHCLLSIFPARHSHLIFWRVRNIGRGIRICRECSGGVRSALQLIQVFRQVFVSSAGRCRC